MTKRDLCIDKEQHLWTLKYARGGPQVHCARCMRCLSVESMLAAYIELYGGIRHLG